MLFQPGAPGKATPALALGTTFNSEKSSRAPVRLVEVLTGFVPAAKLEGAVLTGFVLTDTHEEHLFAKFRTSCSLAAGRSRTLPAWSPH